MGKILAFWVALALALPAHAQTTPETGALPDGAILFVNQERMLVESVLGKRILSLESEERAILSAEGEALAQELELAEQELTDLRATMPPADFRARAEAFNRRVETVRADRLTKDQAQAARIDARRRSFFAVAGQILGNIMVQNRASAIMDRRSVLLFNTGLDITDMAIAELDAAFEANPDLLPETP